MSDSFRDKKKQKKVGGFEIALEKWFFDFPGRKRFMVKRLWFEAFHRRSLIITPSAVKLYSLRDHQAMAITSLR